MEGVFTFFGGRKMFFAIVVLIATGAAYFFGKMAEAAWLDMVKWILIAYLGANVGDSIVARFREQPKPPAPPDPPAPVEPPEDDRR